MANFRSSQFRNEGVDNRHNPEFTTVEFYAAYMDFGALLGLAAKLVRTAAKEVHGEEMKAPFVMNGKQVWFYRRQRQTP